ncbi:MAG TPA: DUF3570 domain-containing protein [Gammaproteobacteria bacterium]|nr:DUF3570 domain-containing protein [Gammaproteobacteria bacterium]
MITRIGILLLVAVAVLVRSAVGGVLPEDRVDVLLHSFDGGGITIQGPSVLVRKQFAQKFSASANYYVDRVQSASIDVITTASPYKEERKQWSVGLDYLHDRWMLNLGIIDSEEPDYSAKTFSFGVSQDLFGDLTTVSLGYSLGRNEVMRRGDPTFKEPMDTQSYRLGLSQILTKNMLLGFSYETITDEGFLNNPYRQVRYLDASNPQGYSYEREVYPRTRTSDAASIRLRYYLPYRAAIYGEYRTFSDTWQIKGNTFELGYTHPHGGWIFDGKLRFYDQPQGASFYSDLFPYANAQNFMARHKELSVFNSQDLRLEASYDILKGGWKFVEKGTVNIVWDHMLFNYDDFRDLRVTGLAPGTEPLYHFDADVFQVFVSFWF